MSPDRLQPASAEQRHRATYPVPTVVRIGSAALAMMLSSLTRYGYRATTVALLLAAAGLLIAGHIWAAVAVLWLMTARFGYYLYLRYKV